MSNLNSNSITKSRQLLPSKLAQSNADTERAIVTMELSLSDHRRLKRLADKTGLKKSTILRALLKLGLEEAKALTSEEDLIKLVRLGKL